MTSTSIQGADLKGDDRLHWLLGRLVHAFGRLDLTLGMQLKWLGPYRGVNVNDLLKATEPFKKRARKLRPLVHEIWGHSNDAAREAFEESFARVEKVRALRNNYAHGRWGRTNAKELNLYEFVALSWVFDPEKMAPAVRITLGELEEQVKEVETLFNDFTTLTTKYDGESRWSKAWEEEHRQLPV